MAATTPGLAAAAADPPPVPGTTSVFGPLKTLSLAGVDKAFVPAFADPDRSVAVMVEMQGEPVAVALAAARDAGGDLSASARTQASDALRASQDAIVPDITRLGGQVHSQLQYAYNGIRVRIPKGKAAQLANLPGVVAVHPIPLAKIDNSSSVPYIGTPAAWQDFGLTGAGVRIGIIDTGIDYFHANFGGSGNPADYFADNSNVVEKGTFPTAKVVGGTDFVGDAYDAGSSDPARNTPKPDPDPKDCSGHGSHVAGTAAGQGVRVNKSPYTGPYNADTHNTGFLVGPGVAPQASLYALKVFGCIGGTDAEVDAIDWAVRHDLDIINLSLGSAFGRAGDPASVAADHAVRVGIVVVASAGNSGRGPYITNSPAVADGVISVAAMDSIVETPTAGFRTDTGLVPLRNLNGSLELLGLGPVRVLTDDPATPVNESRGCFAREYAAVQPREIVVTHRGGCTRIDRLLLGEAAGAGAVIMINNTPGFPPFEGYGIGTIPFLGADQADEAAIVAANGTNAIIEFTAPIPNENVRHLGPFSAAGPRNGDSAQKPDVTAPGVSINSTGFTTGYASNQITGTSMAAPHVAGVAALVRQARPRWKAAEIKAAIINTADPNLLARGIVRANEDVYRTLRAGSGLVVPAKAVATEVIASGNHMGGGLSFGLAESTGITEDTKKITVRNKGDKPVTYFLWGDLSTQAGSPSMFFSPEIVTVPARGVANVDVTLRVDASKAPAGLGDPTNQLLASTSGTVVLQPDGLPLLRVPFSTVVRGTSNISTVQQSVEVADRVTITCVGDGGVLGAVQAFAWGLSDESGDVAGTDLVDVGIVATDGVAAFVLNTANAPSNPSINEWDVMLNTDDDPEFDFAVIGFDLDAIINNSFTGLELATFVVNLETGAIVAAHNAASLMNSGFVALPFLLSEVGLAAGEQEEFSYSAGVFSLEGLGEDTIEETASYNPFTQPVETNVLATVDPDGTPVHLTLAVNREQLARTPVKGWLLFTPFNKSGERQALTVPLHP